MAGTAPAQSRVAVVYYSAVDVAQLQHAVNVLQELQIYEESVVFPVGGEGLPASIEAAMSRGVTGIVFGTHYAYTDEQLPNPLEIGLPAVARFITGPMPDTLHQVALNIPVTGSGAAGAENAALYVARILARSDSALRARLHARPAPSNLPPQT